jgi:hypothetical protein
MVGAQNYFFLTPVHLPVTIIGSRKIELQDLNVNTNQVTLPSTSLSANHNERL